MKERNELVKLGIDVYKNKIANGNFSKNDALKTLREAFIDLNGGETALNFKNMRRNGTEMFEIIEEILVKTVIEGLPEDNFFRTFVDFRNLALGDQNSFHVPDNTVLTVSEMADGFTSLRRQRLDVGGNTSITTSTKGIKIYEELNRLLSGRADFDVLLKALEKAYKLKINNDIYTAFTGCFTSLDATFNVSGSFSESTLLTLCEHLEAATDTTPIIYGTRAALRKISSAIVSEVAKEEYSKLGFYGSFNGIPMVRIKQVHTVGTYTFKLSETDVYITAGDAKPVKFVTEGDATILQGNPMDNADLSQDYLIFTKYGTGVVITDLYAKYSMSS